MFFDRARKRWRIENDLDQQIIGPTECFTLEDFTSYIKTKMTEGGDILYLDKKGDRMVVGFTTTYMQSVPITTNVVSSNPVYGEVYSIQHYVIKIVSDLRQVGWNLMFP
jgi:hypothetical protein